MTWTVLQRSASLMLLDDVNIGDYVIVHAGFAIQKLDEAAAAESIRLLREAAAFVDVDESRSADNRIEVTSTSARPAPRICKRLPIFDNQWVQPM